MTSKFMLGPYLCSTVFVFMQVFFSSHVVFGQWQLGERKAIVLNTSGDSTGARAEVIVAGDSVYILYRVQNAEGSGGWLNLTVQTDRPFSVQTLNRPGFLGYKLNKNKLICLLTQVECSLQVA